MIRHDLSSVSEMFKIYLLYKHLNVIIYCNRRSLTVDKIKIVIRNTIRSIFFTKIHKHYLKKK